MSARKIDTFIINYGCDGPSLINSTKMQLMILNGSGLKHQLEVDVTGTSSGLALHQDLHTTEFFVELTLR